MIEVHLNQRCAALTVRAEKPPRVRSEAMTRWQGTIGANGLRFIPCPTAREDDPSTLAMAPYVDTLPAGISLHSCKQSSQFVLC